jgi:hypothetical protein
LKWSNVGTVKMLTKIWKYANRLNSFIPPPPYGGRPGVTKKVFIVVTNPVSDSFSSAIAVNTHMKKTPSNTTNISVSTCSFLEF